MVDTSRAYRPNHPDVAHESFADEVILIHFQTGRYFRLDAPGRVAWAEIERGATAEGVEHALARAFDAPEADLRAAAVTFLDALLDQSLVVPVDGARAAPTDPSAPSAPPPAAVRAPFTPPRLEVFTDLEDLLLLDPIHDIDESGWPHAKP